MTSDEIKFLKGKTQAAHLLPVAGALLHQANCVLADLPVANPARRKIMRASLLVFEAIAQTERLTPTPKGAQ